MPPRRYLLLPLALLTSLVLFLPANSSAAHQPEPQKKEQPPDYEGLKALKHPDPDVRMNAAQLLCDLGPIAKFAIPTLHEQLKTEKSPVVRVKVAEALWIIEKPAARVLLPVLLEALTDKNEVARANAANVIGQLGPAAKSAVTALAKSLQDKELTVRVEAALALGEIGPAAQAAVPALLETLKSEDVFILEPFVVGSLGKIGEAAVADLIGALSAKELRVRRGALSALALIGPAAVDAVDPLGRMLAAPEPDLRALAARALGWIGKEAKRTVPVLQKLLEDSDASPRIQAAVALWHIESSTDGLTVLVGALKDDRVPIREQACKALSEFGGSKLVPVDSLVQALQDAAPRVRALAADALGKAGQSAVSALPTLRSRFNDDDDFVRVNAALAVWRIDPKSSDAVTTVAATLRSKAAASRKAATIALGNMGTAAIPAWDVLLELYREDAVAQVRRAAGAALRQIDAQAAAKAGVR